MTSQPTLLERNPLTVQAKARHPGSNARGEGTEPEFAPPAGVDWRSFSATAALRGTRTYDPAGQPAAGPIDVVDLFSGCGGLSLGFEIVGRLTSSYRLAAAAEIDHWAVETYAANLPIRPLECDLSAVLRTNSAWAEFKQSLGLTGGPLVLIGGPPCQGFSAHRKKDGKPDDARNDLIGSFAEIAVRLSPDVIVMENVPEVLARKHWKQFAGLKLTLEAAGYHVRAQVHNLASFGVPQERYRAVVIASRSPLAPPLGFLLPSEYRTVRNAIGALPPIAVGERCASDDMHYCTNHRKSTLDVIRQVAKDGGRRPTGVGPKCLDKVDGFRDVYGRLYWDRPSNTITAYARNPASGRYVHPEQDRGLSIREAALLQGFPREFTLAGPFDDRFSQIGNAVPPIAATYIAGHLLGYLAGDALHELPVDSIADVVMPMSDSFSSGIAGRKKSQVAR